MSTHPKNKPSKKAEFARLFALRKVDRREQVKGGSKAGWSTEDDVGLGGIGEHDSKVSIGVPHDDLSQPLELTLECPPVISHYFAPF